MSSIQLKNVRKTFGAVDVIPELDLDIADGEFTVLLGPSGCGKSTILRMIAGLEGVSAGEISIGGGLVNDVSPAKRGCAMVFQNYALYPHKTVRANLGFPLRMSGEASSEADARISEIARMLELEPLLDRYPRQLSGGQRQRVAMGRAMIRKPKVFLYDEPLSNLDLELRVRLRLEIAEMQKMLKSTAVYVTHDQTEAMTLADKIVVLRKGHVEQVGTPHELYHSPANTFVAGFIGTPKMNFFDVSAAVQQEDSTVLTIGGSTVAVPRRLDAAPALIGIRPEHCRTAPRQGAAEILLPDARLRMSEHLGDRSFGYISSAIGEACFLHEGSAQERAADRLVFDADKALFFDAAGHRLD